jgi:hypothetical protein
MLLKRSATDTHIALEVLVGAGMDQQPHTVRATMIRGNTQRRHSALRVGLTATNKAPPQTQWKHQNIHRKSNRRERQLCEESGNKNKKEKEEMRRRAGKDIFENTTPGQADARESDATQPQARQRHRHCTHSKADIASKRNWNETKSSS